MSIPFRRVGAFLLTAALTAAALALAAPPPAPPEESDFKDRKEFIPNRRYQSLPGTTIGVLVGDVAAMMNQEGRSGPPDALAFSRDGGSYRWVYVPANGNAIISNLQVKVGEKGDKTVVYPALNMANPETVKQWEIKTPYALVEVDVNDTRGAPADEDFVSTRMKRLDDTKEYPLLVTEAIASLRDRYAARVKDMKKSIDDALDAESKNAKLTGPRETAELMYVTWLPDSDRLCVRFRTTLKDGAYQYGGGGPEDRPPDPARTAVHPIEGQAGGGQAGGGQAGGGQAGGGQAGGGQAGGGQAGGGQAGGGQAGEGCCAAAAASGWSWGQSASARSTPSSSAFPTKSPRPAS